MRHIAAEVGHAADRIINRFWCTVSMPKARRKKKQNKNNSLHNCNRFERWKEKYRYIICDRRFLIIVLYYSVYTRTHSTQHAPHGQHNVCNSSGATESNECGQNVRSDVWVRAHAQRPCHAAALHSTVWTRIGRRTQFECETRSGAKRSHFSQTRHSQGPMILVARMNLMLFFFLLRERDLREHTHMSIAIGRFRGFHSLSVSDLPWAILVDIEASFRRAAKQRS